MGCGAGKQWTCPSFDVFLAWGVPGQPMVTPGFGEFQRSTGIPLLRIPDLDELLVCLGLVWIDLAQYSMLGWGFFAPWLCFCCRMDTPKCIICPFGSH